MSVGPLFTVLSLRPVRAGQLCQYLHQSLLHHLSPRIRSCLEFDLFHSAFLGRVSLDGGKERWAWRNGKNIVLFTLDKCHYNDVDISHLLGFIVIDNHFVRNTLSITSTSVPYYIDVCENDNVMKVLYVICM